MGETNNAISIETTKSKEVELATRCLQYMYHGFKGFHCPDSFMLQIQLQPTNYILRYGNVLTNSMK